MKLLFLLLVVSACSSNKASQLHQASKNVEVFENVPTDCNVVGKIEGINKQGSKELALNHALNQAADMGATGIVVNQEVPNGNKMSVHATAYRCE